jgi:hypothetical protein
LTLPNPRRWLRTILRKFWNSFFVVDLIYWVVNYNNYQTLKVLVSRFLMLIVIAVYRSWVCKK